MCGDVKDFLFFYNLFILQHHSIVNNGAIEGFFHRHAFGKRSGASSHAIIASSIDGKEGIAGRQSVVEEIDLIMVVIVGVVGSEAVAVGLVALAPHAGRFHVEVPIVAGEGVKRGVVHACQQGGSHVFVLIVLDVDGPGLLAAGAELVAHGGEGDVEVEVVVRNADRLFLDVIGVFLDESGLETESATVFFLDFVGDGLDVVVEGDPLFHTDFHAMHHLHPYPDVLGRAADVGAQFVTGLQRGLVGLVPGHRHARRAGGVFLVNLEFLGGDGQRFVKTLEFDIVSARLQGRLAGVEGGLLVDQDLVLVNQGLMLHLVVAAVEAEGGELVMQLFVAECLPVEGDVEAVGIEIVDAVGLFEAVDEAFHAALGGLTIHVDHFDAVVLEGRLFHQVGDVGADGDLVITGTDVMGVAMGLALGTGGGDFDLIGEHRLLFGLGLQ